MANIHVIGCGVSGLSTAIRLQEAGHRVTIISRDHFRDTVSAVAAAIWFPFSAEPQERVNAWSKETFNIFRRLAEQPEKTGVFMTDFLVFIEDPAYVYWESALPKGIKSPAAAGEIPEQYHSGYYVRVPLSDSSKYMPYLMERFESAGGQVEYRTVTDLQSEARRADWLVNCTGMGARELCDDQELYPIRGQVLRLKKTDIPVKCFIDEYMPHRIAYALPRTDDIILGGTAIAHDASTEEDTKATQTIQRLCTQHQPQLKDLELLEVVVGHRPGRSSVRLEREPGTNIIHNYGHGGSGYTISWGCAEEVVKVVDPSLTAETQ